MKVNIFYRPEEAMFQTGKSLYNKNIFCSKRKFGPSSTKIVLVMFCVLFDVEVLTGSWLGLLGCHLELHPKCEGGYWINAPHSIGIVDMSLSYVYSCLATLNFA